jgi:hypothetical protein
MRWREENKMALKYNPQQRKQAGGGPNDPNIPIEPKGIQQPLLMPTDDLKNSTFTNRPVYNGLTGGLSMSHLCQSSASGVDDTKRTGAKAQRRSHAPAWIAGQHSQWIAGFDAWSRTVADEEGGGMPVQTWAACKPPSRHQTGAARPAAWTHTEGLEWSDVPTVCAKLRPAFSLYFSPSFRRSGPTSGLSQRSLIYPFLSPGGGLAGSNPVGVNVYGYNDDGYRKWYRSGGSGISYRGSPSPWYQTLINWRI